MATLLVVAILIILATLVSGFRWHLNDLLPARKILTFSERYMFASHKGPPMLEQGEAYIDIQATVTTYTTSNKTSPVAVSIFSADEDHHHDTLLGMCGEDDIHSNTWANNVYSTLVKAQYKGVVHVSNMDMGLNGTYHRWESRIRAHYKIQKEDWHNVAFQFCGPQYNSPIARIDGTVVFRNPYGFIPGEMYGFLPFEGARMIAYVLFGVFYTFLYWKFRSALLPLHHAIFFVYIVALTEATTWYAAYQSINLSGEPYCCPFPGTVVAALVLQVFRQTLARTLLLVVCLGYGIVRPKLLSSEWMAVGVMTVLYFIAAVVAQTAEIIIVNDVRSDVNRSTVAYQFPELFMDVIFLSWIYYALGSTIRILTEFQQTVKLDMYKHLSYVIAIFVALFAVVTVLILMDKSAYIKWPWQFAWLQQVLWEVLNFAVLVTVCTICRPCETSRLLSYAHQLPTEDPDDYDDEDDNEKGHRSTSHEDEDDNYDDEDDEDGFEMVDRNSNNNNNNKKNNNSRKNSNNNNNNNNLYTLPAADDEEFGLQDE